MWTLNNGVKTLIPTSLPPHCDSGVKSPMLSTQCLCSPFLIHAWPLLPEEPTTSSHEHPHIPLKLQMLIWPKL